ncbi:MAG: diguanylate cyclase [Campylobacterota bacterium]|nr:diguanylate cyclase [Campylobacterota bacterium]
MRNALLNSSVILLFLLIQLFGFILLSIDKHKRISHHLENTTHSIEVEYQTVYNAFKNKSDIVYNTLINKPKIKALLREALHADQEGRDNARRKLQALLQPDYDILKGSYLKQLHFHTPKNHSFLRMHKPDKYGDDLSTARETIAYVNQQHRPIDGFELGRVASGFRFVYPLFDSDDTYLGSVEVSRNSYIFIDMLNTPLHYTHLLFSKRRAEQKAWQSLKKHYVTSSINEHFLFNRSEDVERYGSDLADLKQNTHLSEAMHTNKAFSVYAEGENGVRLYTFIPIKNPVTKGTVAHIQFISESPFITRGKIFFWLAYAFYLILTTLLLLLYCRQQRLQKDLSLQVDALNNEKKKLSAVIDNINNIIIITDGLQIIEVNRKFYDFFGYSDLAQFKAKHPCICDLFLEVPGFFHLGEVPEQSNWIDYMQTLDENGRIVSILDLHDNPKAFLVTFNTYDDHAHNVVSFNDITDLMIEKKQFEIKAYYDHLTGIFNRQKFNELLISETQQASLSKRPLSIIMFDIDHFKPINDTYGHDVGDDVLIQLAKTVKAVLREDDLFGRWGGEEFMILLPHTNVANAALKAERVRQEIESFSQEGLPPFTASFGVTVFEEDESIDAFLKRVDEALYEAKHGGRNMVVGR